MSYLTLSLHIHFDDMADASRDSRGPSNLKIPSSFFDSRKSSITGNLFIVTVCLYVAALRDVRALEFLNY